jgi:dipeptidyl aminopeptidase/acylaminoacyl peptidase
MPLARSRAVLFAASALVFASSNFALAQTTDAPTLTPGNNLIIEDLPPVPLSLVQQASPYLESRSATFQSWDPLHREMLISTRFAQSPQIHRVAMPGGSRSQLTFFADPVRTAIWQPKQGKYFLFAKDSGGGEFYQFYRDDQPSGAVTLVTDGKSRNTGPVFSRDGSLLACGSTQRSADDVDLWVMDPANPASAHLLTQWKGGGMGALDWSPDGSQILAIDYRSINDSTLYLVDAKTGERKQLTPTEPTTAPVAWSDAKFAADGKSVYATTDKDSDFQRLCRLSLGGVIEDCLTKDIPHDVEQFALSGDGKYLAFLVNDDGVSSLHVRDLAAGKDIPLAAIPVGVAEGLKFREKTDELGFALSTPQQPFDAYSVELPSGKLTRWTTSETGGISFAGAKSPELVHWKAADGIDVSGFLYPPPAKFAGKRPVMIDIHGGPEGQSRPDFLGSLNYYVQALGIALIEPNVRGSVGYGKNYSMLDNGMKRQDSVRDIGALLDWIKTRPDLDPDRVIIIGGSYGGFMTLSVATQYNDRIRCSIDIVGPSNLVTFLENTSGYRRDLRRVEYGDERDPAMRAFLEKTAPANHADAITKPIFIVAGVNDPRVPYTESVNMATAVRKNGSPVWFLGAKDEGHGFQKKPNSDYFFYSSVQFVERYLLK